MTMKKILMAAVAVTALTAGAANAATISTVNTTGSTVGTKFLNPTLGTTPEAYTVASELNLTGISSINTVLKIEPSSPTAIGIGNYLVTYNISGGTFDVSGITTASLSVGGAGSTVTSTSTVSASSVSFVVNVASANLTGLSLSVPVLTGTSRTPIVVSGNIQTTASLLAVDGGAVPAVTIVDYRDGMKFAAAKADLVLSLASSFKKFTPGTDLVEANIATTVGFAPNTGTNPSDVVFKDLVGTPLTTADISSAVLTIGGDLSAFNVKLGAASNSGTLGADNVAVPGVITADTTNLTALKSQIDFITLAQKSTPVAGSESSYTVTPVITLPVGMTALTYTAKAIGSVSYEGNAIYAPWVGDGANGSSYTIRLGNRTGTAINSVKVSLVNPFVTGTSGTVASTASCEVGPLPASGELLITNTKLVACFGAFKRSDVKVLFQGAYTSVSAKLRTITAGITTDVPLGNGTDVAKAN